MKAAIDADLAAVGPQAGHRDGSARRPSPSDGVLATGTTTVGYMCHLAYPVYQPRTYITSSTWAPSATASRRRSEPRSPAPTCPWCRSTATAGFLFCASELATAVQYGINVVTVVFNDSAYGNTNRDQVEHFGGRVIGTELVNPDFVAFAESFGAVGTRVTTPTTPCAVPSWTAWPTTGRS